MWKKLFWELQYHWRLSSECLETPCYLLLWSLETVDLFLNEGEKRNFSLSRMAYRRAPTMLNTEPPMNKHERNYNLQHLNSKQNRKPDTHLRILLQRSSAVYITSLYGVTVPFAHLFGSRRSRATLLSVS
jgi:hypothetical protein